MGTDSGLKVFLGDESNANSPSARSNDVELVHSSGLRHRKQSHSRNDSNGSIGSPQSMTEVPNESGPAAQRHIVVEHHRGPSPSDGGWIGRIAALLVGEDPSQSYALICGNCLRHNGMLLTDNYDKRVILHIVICIGNKFRY